MAPRPSTVIESGPGHISSVMSPFHRISRSFAGLSPPVRAMLWMVLACFVFSILNALIRATSHYLHPFQVAFFRNLFGLAFMLPWLMRAGLTGLQTGRFQLYFWRVVIGLASMLTWFFALALLPFAQAVALSFAAPLFATVLAATLLGETVRARRWTATFVGFAGVLVIVRPGIDSISLGAILALVSAALSSVSVIVVKQLSRTEPINAVVTYMVLLMTPMSLVPALFHWVWPPLEVWPLLVGMGLSGTLGHLCYVRSLHMADASAVMPFDYTRLLFAAILGWLFFSEIPDLWTWVGAAVIVASALYIAHREGIARHAAGTAEAATKAAASAAEPTLNVPAGGRNP
ncbi:MAG: DMT family transporter [Dongiaceae bacterium]